MGSPEDRIFYHALYYLVSHWAAFIASLGLLVTTGVIVSTVATPLNGIRRLYCQAAIATMFFGSWFFLWRMYTFSSIVQRMLPRTYLQELALVGANPTILGVALVATCGFAGFSSTVLWWPRRKRRAPTISK